MGVRLRPGVHRGVPTSDTDAKEGPRAISAQLPCLFIVI